MSKDKQCECKRCGYRWISIIPHPERCANPKCRSPYWKTKKRATSTFSQFLISQGGRYVAGLSKNMKVLMTINRDGAKVFTLFEAEQFKDTYADAGCGLLSICEIEPK